jgi:hypothetical protein
MVEKNIFGASPFLCTDVYFLLPLACANQLEIFDMAITCSISVDRKTGQLEGTVSKFTRKEHITT